MPVGLCYVLSCFCAGNFPQMEVTETIPKLLGSTKVSLYQVLGVVKSEHYWACLPLTPDLKI